MPRPQRRKPFNPQHPNGQSRRTEYSKPEPYRTNGVVLSPRRTLRKVRGNKWTGPVS
jgi:hypothetical protein